MFIESSGAVCEEGIWEIMSMLLQEGQKRSILMVFCCGLDQVVVVSRYWGWFVLVCSWGERKVVICGWYESCLKFSELAEDFRDC